MSDSSGQGRILPKGSVVAEYVAHLVDVCARFGVRTDVLLKGTGIRVGDLERPDDLVPSDRFHALVRRALSLTREPGLGYHFGLSLKLSSHGAPGLLAMTSGTLGDALAVAQRFSQLRAVDLSLVTLVEGDDLVLEFEHLVPEDARVFAAEGFFVTLLQMGRALVGHPIAARCEMAFPEPAHFKRFAHLLPERVRFGVSKNRLSIPLPLLREAVVTSDSVMARRIERELQQELEQLDERASFLSRVRRQMRPELPSLEELADRLHTSTRTLKRKLASHGTTYRQLVEELRRERAEVLLRETDLTMTQIAERLGYTDRASFHRAYRRWFGATPQVSRRGSSTA